MGNQEYLELIKKGVEAWNAWRKTQPVMLTIGVHKPFIIPEDSPFDLNKSDLTGGKFGGVNFSFTSFAGAILNGADLSNANLCFVNFLGTQVQDTDFTNAELNFTNFYSVDLSRTKGLDRVRHRGPSSINVETIYLSKGKIPENFLRGCGVPDSLITYIPSLISASDGIQFYSCFISHSSKDEEFVQRLHGRMQQAHLRVWYAPDDLQGGKKLYEQIDEAIRIYDKLLVVLSENSLQSEWVMTEIRNARKHERETGKRKLFPIRLVDFETIKKWECFDTDSGKDLAIECREYFIPDFSNWKDHDAFEANFKKLLDDLRPSIR
jgi:TIR domain-containing protein/pentapeptide repeat protein